MELRVDRHGDESGPPDAEQRLDVLGHVARDKGDALARRESRGLEGGGDARGMRRELAVGADDAVAEPDRRPSRPRPRRAREQRGDVAVISTCRIQRSLAENVRGTPRETRYNGVSLRREPNMPLPSTMRYIAAREPGPPDVLALAEGPLPTPKAGEVLIEVVAAGVNRPDCLQRSGAYPPPPDASPIIGLEVAGTVVALGEGAHGVAVGDRVCALTPGGGYAEYCTTPAGWCLPVPKA